MFKSFFSLVGDALFFTLQPFFPKMKHYKPLRYFHEKCSNEVHSLVPPTATLPVTTHLTMQIDAKHTHSLCITLVRHKFHSDTFFPITFSLQKKIPRGCFPTSTNLTSSSLGLSILFPTYLHKRCPLLLLVTQQLSSVTLYLEQTVGLIQSEH